MSKHTPGPWKWTWPDGPNDPPQLEGNIEYADQNPVLVVHGCSPSCMHKYNKPCPLVPKKADMNLIAAVPDLPKAAKAIMNSNRGEHLPAEKVGKMMEAIAKAEGEIS